MVSIACNQRRRWLMHLQLINVGDEVISQINQALLKTYASEAEKDYFFGLVPRATLHTAWKPKSTFSAWPKKAKEGRLDWSGSGISFANIAKLKGNNRNK
ncbi:hypothetical protein WN943_003798 [Citrus x changshan-huyou]